MAAGRIVLSQYFPARDRNARLVSGALLYVYTNGTTTKASIYSNEALTTALANPVEANSSGQFPAIWASDAVTYTLSITDADGRSIGNPSVFDNYSVSTDADTASVALAEAAATSAAADLADMLAVIATGDDAAAIAARAAKSANGSDFASPTSVPANIGLTDYASTINLAAANLPVSPAAFGLFTNATVTTATLKAAFDYAIANKRPIVLKGDYTVNGPLCTASVVADGVLDLRIEGEATITVDAASTSFQFLIACLSTALNSHYISGGTLTIVGNDKVERAITLQSAEGTTTAGAEVVISAPTRITGCYLPSGSTGGATYGIHVNGPFSRVVIADANVESLSRHTSLDATGACQAIRTDFVRGPVTFIRPIIRNILNAVQDADGIFVRGPLESSIPICPATYVIDGIFEDCQGRSIKTQCAHTVVTNPTFIRNSVQSITQGHDIDAQYGSLEVDGWTAEYRAFDVLGVATSPLGTSFRPFIIQALYNDAPKFSRIGPGKITTDVAVPNLLSLVIGASSPAHEVVIDGAVIQSLSTLATTALSRSLVEFSASQIKASSNKLTLRVRNTTAPNTNPLIGYSGGDGTDLSAKLEIHAVNNRTTLAAGNSTRTFRDLSGTALDNLVPYCAFGPNPGYHQVFEGSSATPFAFNWNTVPPGCDYYIDLDGWTSTNGPTLPTTSAYARVQTGHGESSWYTIRSRRISWLDGMRSYEKYETGWQYTGKSGKSGTTSVGDAAATLTAMTSTINQVWGTTLTADRAVTLSTTGALAGDTFRISRPAAGAFNLNVGTGPLKALPAGSWCEVVYSGSAWVLTAHGTL